MKIVLSKRCFIVSLLTTEETHCFYPMDKGDYEILFISYLVYNL